MNKSPRPAPPVRRLFTLAAWLAGGSGVAYGVLRYLWPRDDPFALVNHPWQPHLQHLHVLVAPLAVFALGAVWVAHVRPARAAEAARRGSGAVAWWLAVVMVASGALIQVLTDSVARAAAGWVHTAASLAWLSALLLHCRRDRQTPP